MSRYVVPALLLALQVLSLQAAAPRAGMLPPDEPARLASDPEWLHLLHYRPLAGGRGYRSELAAARFFVSPDGADNPAAELRESLARLQGGADRAEAFACRFPARSAWLRQRMPARLAAIAAPHCAALERWRAEIDARQLTLVFAAAFVNSPPSMFGHPLLRFDNDKPALAAYALNFSIPLGTDGVLAYSARAVSGGYGGTFSIAPYYQKLREYQHVEQRDIWEYRLALTPPEVERLLLHVWELQEAEFPYYFLDENCASRLLELLDIARPALQLQESRRPLVLPRDLLRSLASRPGVVSSVRFVTAGGSAVEAPEQALPHAGHASSNIEVAATRVSRPGGAALHAVELMLRSGYHGLLDPPAGFQAGANIDFLSARLRFHDAGVRLEAAQLIAIDSRAPGRAEGLAPSWRGGAEFSREHSVRALESGQLSLQPYFSAGYAAHHSGAALFAELELRGALSPAASESGFGPRLGALYQDRAGLTVSASATHRIYTGSAKTLDEAEFALGLALTPAFTLSATFSVQSADGGARMGRGSVGLRRYF